jgi:hypothetical protein
LILLTANSVFRKRAAIAASSMAIFLTWSGKSSKSPVAHFGNQD